MEGKEVEIRKKQYVQHSEQRSLNLYSKHEIPDKEVITKVLIHRDYLPDISHWIWETVYDIHQYGIGTLQDFLETANRNKQKLQFRNTFINESNKLM